MKLAQANDPSGSVQKLLLVDDLCDQVLNVRMIEKEAISNLTTLYYFTLYGWPQQKKIDFKALIIFRFNLHHLNFDHPMLEVL